MTGRTFHCGNSPSPTAQAQPAPQCGFLPRVVTVFVISLCITRLSFDSQLRSRASAVQIKVSHLGADGNPLQDPIVQKNRRCSTWSPTTHLRASQRPHGGNRAMILYGHVPLNFRMGKTAKRSTQRNLTSTKLRNSHFVVDVQSIDRSVHMKVYFGHSCEAA